MDICEDLTYILYGRITNDYTVSNTIPICEVKILNGTQPPK